MKYYGGCDVGSTYTKAVILDETGKMVANTTIRSKMNSEQSATFAMKEVIDQVPELSSSKATPAKTSPTLSAPATAATRSPSRMRTSPRSAATPWASTSPTPMSAR